MVDKKLFDEITDWSRIDYICIKSKMRSLDTSVYYLDGHPMFEKTLSGSDMEFMDFVREIKGYGTSEKMIDSKTTMDRFYVRVNLENDQQERELIDYLKKKVKTCYDLYCRHDCINFNYSRCTYFSKKEALMRVVIIVMEQ